MKYPVVKDSIERVVATFVVTILGLATADGIDLQSFLSIDNWKTWATAAVVAAFTVVKTIIAAQISKRGGKAVSASLVPTVVLQPENDVR